MFIFIKTLLLLLIYYLKLLHLVLESDCFYLDEVITGEAGFTLNWLGGLGIWVMDLPLGSGSSSGELQFVLLRRLPFLMLTCWSFLLNQIFFSFCFESVFVWNSLQVFKALIFD